MAERVIKTVEVSDCGSDEFDIYFLRDDGSYSYHDTITSEGLSWLKPYLDRNTFVGLTSREASLLIEGVFTVMEGREE